MDFDDSIACQCRVCRQPIGLMSPGGVLVATCPNCWYRWRVIEGTVTSRSVWQGTEVLRIDHGFEVTELRYRLEVGRTDRGTETLEIVSEGFGDFLSLDEGDAITAWTAMDGARAVKVVEVRVVHPLPDGEGHTTCSHHLGLPPDPAARRLGWMLSGVLVALSLAVMVLVRWEIGFSLIVTLLPLLLVPWLTRGLLAFLTRGRRRRNLQPFAAPP